MNVSYSSAAIRNTIKGNKTFCKFLSANDTGATGGHQSGILVSKSALEMMFSAHQIKREHILKRAVRIVWQDSIVTDSSFTWYASKNELRITRFGKGFPFLNSEETGALFILVQMTEDDYYAYILESEEEIEGYLNAFSISPAETNSLVRKDGIRGEIKETAAIKDFIDSLTEDFPTSEEMSYAAQNLTRQIYNQKDIIMRNPDQCIIDWTKMEYSIFRALEQSRYLDYINHGFESVDEFVKLANIVLNRRKSRAGKSLEHHLSAVFTGNRILFTPQAVTEGNKRPDFIFPSQEAYHNPAFPEDWLISLAAKTTCKDRWRQVLNEADRLRNRPKYLCTLQQGISGAQMDEMQAENVILVVPGPYISAYPKDRRDRVWSIKKFVTYVKETEGIM